MAWACPSPYAKNVAWHVVRGPSHATRACERVPPASCRPMQKTSAAQRPRTFFDKSMRGEGQALALRCNNSDPNSGKLVRRIVEKEIGD